MTTVQAYDFRRTETLERQDIRVLNAALDTFSRHGSVELSTSLRKASQISLSGLAERSWHELTNILGERPYLATIGLEPLEGKAILSLPLDRAIRIIDLRLGGGTLPPFARHAELTETDLSVLAGILTPLVKEIGSSLSHNGGFSGTLVSQESNVQMAQFAAQLEMFLVASFTLSVGTDGTANMTLGFPIEMVRQMTEALRSDNRGRSEVHRLVSQDMVSRTPIDVWLEIPAVPLAPSAIADLAVGDVIPFYHPITEPLDVRAGGVVVARARQYAAGSKVVCSITEEVATDGD